MLAITLLVAATGTAVAHGNGGYSGGGTMGGGGWGLFDGAIGLVGLLWMGLVIAVPLFVAYLHLTRGPDDGVDGTHLNTESYIGYIVEIVVYTRMFPPDQSTLALSLDR